MSANIHWICPKPTKARVIPSAAETERLVRQGAADIERTTGLQVKQIDIRSLAHNTTSNPDVEKYPNAKPHPNYGGYYQTPKHITANYISTSPGKMHINPSHVNLRKTGQDRYEVDTVQFSDRGFVGNFIRSSK